MSPRMALLAFQAGISQVDVRDILGSVRVPTLVLHRRDEVVPLEYGRELAAKIPGARLVELDGVDHWPGAGDIKSITGEVEEFLTGHRHAHAIDRVLATVLFTDIVDSTGQASRLGDRQWRARLDAYDRAMRQELDAFRGHQVKTTGDGTLATFDGPARAIRCAAAVTSAVRELGLTLRSGLHIGEVELRGDGDIAGIAVHIARRVEEQARPGEEERKDGLKAVEQVKGYDVDTKDLKKQVYRGVEDARDDAEKSVRRKVKQARSYVDESLPTDTKDAAIEKFKQVSRWSMNPRCDSH